MIDPILTVILCIIFFTTGIGTGQYLERKRIMNSEWWKRSQNPRKYDKEKRAENEEK